MFNLVTVLMLTYYAYRLFKPIETIKIGELLKEYSGLDKEEIIERIYNTDNPKEAWEEILKIIFKLIFIWIQQCIEFIYLIFALKYDILFYPTLVIILWWIIGIAKPNKKSIDDLIEEHKTRKSKTKRNVIAIIDIVYFGYMFVLVISQYLYL